MEMPYYLKTLPGEALDIIRFYGALDNPQAFAADIMSGTGLSDRGFGKAIRRLVTKGFVVMDGDQQYRLTERGSRAVEELRAVEAAGPVGEATAAAAPVEKRVQRRLVLVVPQPITAGVAAEVAVGVNAVEDAEAVLLQPVDLLLRLAVVNGQPAQAAEATLSVQNDAAQERFIITPERYRQVRLRLQAFQIDDDMEAVRPAGGLYVDVDVQPETAPEEPILTAFGIDTQVVVAE